MSFPSLLHLSLIQEQTLESKVCLSLDAWTSSNQYVFLAIVAHYVSNNGQLGEYFFSSWTIYSYLPFSEELLINFRELIGEHSGENMAEAVWQTLELYGLVGKVRSLLSFQCIQLTHSHR